MVGKTESDQVGISRFIHLTISPSWIKNDAPCSLFVANEVDTVIPEKNTSVE